ncbi:helix-turn-helix transcriptional regulator [Georgenia yuyongxinii]|uniref:helix-turn-helix transcriptional regulator n=1 Tax=Georgenia yuyongxinii TaxID=2589797 RepID=UPI00163DCC18|nr:LuxR family transcriptional regulator [Georgenia yuyongxinii]
MSVGAEHPALAGRDVELAQLLEVVDDAAAGRSGMRLLVGAPGIGKTALLSEVCRLTSARAEIMMGAGLPLTSLSVPLLPIAAAVRRWASSTGAPVPTLPQPGQSTDHVVVEFDSWLDRLCARRPVLLAVDDLHWADQSTLDLLTYVLAGPPERPLAVLLASRDLTLLRDGHPLHRWLADSARMPRFSQTPVGPLDRLGTANQMAAILGGPARESLVDDVYSHTRGNAYLTRLIVEHLPLDAHRLPAELPTTLREAVLQPWHDMTPAARELTRLLAVGAAPLPAAVLSTVSAAVGLPDDVVPLLHEAVAAGLLEVHASGAYWFRHPLQAEVLESGVLPEERRAWHTAFATALEARTTSHGVRAVAAVADHHFRAGNDELAYRWALRAARAAADAHGTAEMLRLLRRAVVLHRRVHDPPESRVELLQQVRSAAERVGRQEEELTAVDQLLAEPLDDPLAAAALRVRRMNLRHSTGRKFAGLDDVREAVRLSAPWPHSWQYAYALAELAHAEIWHDDLAGDAHAEAAVEAARVADDRRALPYALAARSMARTMWGGGGPPARDWADEAIDAAVDAQDWWAFSHVALWEANAVAAGSEPAYTVPLRARRRQLAALGAPHTYVGFLCAAEASSLLTVGRWQECQENLRVALGSSPGPMGEVTARLTAALLATRQGRLPEGQGHLHRAEELYEERSGYLAFEFDASRAEVALAAGNLEGAVAAALTGVSTPGPPPTRAEWLLPLAARALADLAQEHRDHGTALTETFDRLRELRRAHPAVLQDGGSAAPWYAQQLAALQAMYDVEWLRAQADPGAGPAWAEVAERCAAVSLPWDAAYAACRAAEAYLTDRRGRARGTAWLRRAHEMASDLSAVPLLTELEDLARTARISLSAVPGPSRDRDDKPVSAGHAFSALAGITAREQEVLGLVVAGRTYGEIARALSISEKTVSVHISHLLQKTGTASRLELARLAQRAERPGSEQAGHPGSEGLGQPSDEAGRPGPGRPGPERPSPGRPSPGRPGTDRPGPGRPGPERTRRPGRGPPG